jgi:chemotaxis protein MotB
VLTSPGQTEAGPQLHIAPKPDPAKSIAQSIDRAADKQDLDNLRRIQAQVNAYARTHGFAGLIRTSIDERGLVIRLLTDELLFDTGRADLKTRSLPLLARISSLLSSGDLRNPVRVEGNTDSVPISTGQFRSNWELSTARANAVLEFLLAHGVKPLRLSATGYGSVRPIAPNATAEGRAKNRRVELVVLRRALAQGGLQ